MSVSTFPKKGAALRYGQAVAEDRGRFAALSYRHRRNVLVPEALSNQDFFARARQIRPEQKSENALISDFL